MNLVHGVKHAQNHANAQIVFLAISKRVTVLIMPVCKDLQEKIVTKVPCGAYITKIAMKNRLTKLSLFQLDIDECAIPQRLCHQRASCINTIGSFKCKCDLGWTGDGFHCVGTGFVILSFLFLSLFLSFFFAVI